METKIKIKFGSLEVDYEGNEAFVKDGLFDLILKVSKLDPPSAPVSEMQEPANFVQVKDASKSRTGNLQMTTGMIASKLRCKTGGDLVLAACAHLTLAKGLEDFSRDEIREEMKIAKSFYKETFRKSLSKYLRVLVSDDQLTEPQSDRYCLSERARQRLENQLAT